MSDVYDYMSQNDKTNSDIVAKVHKLINSNHLTLETIPEDTYLQSLLEYVFDNSEDVFTLSLGDTVYIECDSMISDSVYSTTMFRIIVEEMLFPNVFLNLNKEEVLFNANIENCIQTTIDSGLITGSDIVEFISLAKSTETIKALLEIVLDTIKFTIGETKNTFIPIGWSRLNHLVLVHLIEEVIDGE